MRFDVGRIKDAINGELRERFPLQLETTEKFTLSSASAAPAFWHTNDTASGFNVAMPEHRRFASWSGLLQLS